MMKQNNDISFRLVAYTDAAGKYSPDAFRGGNEDNFYVNEDLTDDTTNRVPQDEILKLGELGMLMVVADGMGGMNAGEVASQIAVDTVKAEFKAGLLTNAITKTSLSRQDYLEQVIKHADKNIKEDAHNNSNNEGMGSTIIIAWLFNDELSISWCGDSRAYLFNEKSGIRLISQDHSYVQDLVNNGILTYDQTFDHPQNNIITRSLGDPTKVARPESKTLKVGKGDIILLCSDGLSGVLRDRKTYDANGQLLPEENIEDIIRANTSSMKDCREALWLAAERENWYDNVTAILCQITDGPESHWTIMSDIDNTSNVNSSKKKIWMFLCVGAIIILSIIMSFFIGKNSQGHMENKSTFLDTIKTLKKDSIAITDSLKQKISIGTVDENAKKAENKLTIQEQIRKQDREKTDSVSPSNGLTKIDKQHERNNRTKENSKLTPIEDRLKKNKSDNPLSPTKPQQDNINDTSNNK